MSSATNPYESGSNIPGGPEREHAYRTAPLASDRMPPGIPYIVANEAAERFSFYGMRGILVVFMTKHLLDRSGALAPMDEDVAKAWYHTFVSTVYFFPMLGAIVSDVFWGKYRTILVLSIVYCLGHLALALDETRLGLVIGLGLIAVGSGGIKPCVSAHVGDQFGASNKHLIERVFGWFYLSINMGAFFSTMLTPWLLEHESFGPRWAFGVPGVLMLLATILFWLGRNRFVHVPPAGSRFLHDIFSAEGSSALLRLGGLYLMVAMFWCLYDQSGSAWVLQAQKMDRAIGSWTISAAQTHAANPIMILIFIPLSSYVIYPLASRVVGVTPLRKVGAGMLLTAASFATVGIIELEIARRAAADLAPLHVAWQLVPYTIMGLAEVLVSVTCLEFSYTQAPRSIKSVVMAVFLLSVTLGNGVAAIVNGFFIKPWGLTGATYYFFFVGLMLATTFIFMVVSPWYREKMYVQEEVSH